MSNPTRSIDELWRQLPPVAQLELSDFAEFSAKKYLRRNAPQSYQGDNLETFFSHYQADFTGFKFNRDEANER
ncbi:Uncharacterised protein [Candidatus Venteria ishoeyi]|uniref:Uncharacterized protein n=2 Tax=Candidatus Venteria ishoeyi TaxID=1899563 RepID=A0A1H6F6D2_9GAMM|nr:Uncharacterised protein [Candidatus Venteria ishoeyi]